MEVKYETALKIFRKLLLNENYTLVQKEGESLADFQKRVNGIFSSRPEEGDGSYVADTREVILANLTNGQSQLEVLRVLKNLHNNSYIGSDWRTTYVFAEKNDTLDYRSTISSDGDVTAFLAKSPGGIVAVLYYAGTKHYQTIFVGPLKLNYLKPEDIESMFTSVRSDTSLMYGTASTILRDWEVNHDEEITFEEAHEIFDQLVNSNLKIDAMAQYKV